MCADYARYDSPTNAPDSSASLSAREREELHRSLTQPGFVRLDGSGQVQYSQPSEPVRPNTPAPGTRVVHNGKPCFVSREGEFIPTDVAANYPPELFRLFPQTDASAESAKSGDQPQQTQETISWSHPDADAVMTEMGSLPESAIENMVALAADGTSELTDYVAQGIAQVVPGLTPDMVKENYAKAVNAAQEAADRMVEEQGVDANELYASLTDGERHDIADAFARGNAAPLVNVAKTYLGRHGGQAQVDGGRLLDPRNTVNGGKVWRDAATKRIMVQPDGLDQPVTLETAIEAKMIRVNWA